MHLKRRTIENSWPIARKGTKYLIVPTHEASKGIPVLVVVRDILHLVKTKKELKGLLKEKGVLVNQKVIREFGYPVTLFDSLSFPHIKKSYKAVLNEKKIGFEEISEKDAGIRMFRIESKKLLGSKKIQINLSNGRNILSSEKMNVGDFVTISLTDNKIVKVSQIEKGSHVVVIKGKYLGSTGKVKNLLEENHEKVAEIASEGGKGDLKIGIKNLFLIGAKS